MESDPRALLERVVAEAWLPDPLLSVSEWADARRMLSPRASAEHGPWRTSRTPYLREPMDALGPESGVTDHVWVFASQMGKSEGANNVVGHRADISPCPMLVVQPTLDLAKRFSKMRLAPMIESTPSLAARVKPSRSRDGGNTLLMKEFLNQALLVVGGANAASGLASMPICLLVLDEEDRFPLDVDGEGSPSKLAEVRTRTFGRRARRLRTSTPTLADRSAVWAAFDESDQRRYYVPCPHCGERQVLRWEQMRYDPADPLLARGRLSQPPVMVCDHCGTGIEEHAKSWWYGNDLGEWVPTVPESPIRGYHLPAFYAPLGWLSWEKIVIDYEQAKGTPERLKVWTNTVLAETWAEEGEAPEWERLYRRRESYRVGTVPGNGPRVLTAGVDVQRDRLELEVVAWGQNMESWSIDYLVLPGDTGTIQSDPAQPCVWRALAEQLTRRFRRDDGSELGIARVAVDSGDQTQTVYSWVRSQHDPRIVATKGRDQLTTILGIPKAQDVNVRGRKVLRGIKLWPVGVSVAKHELYGWLRQDPPLHDGDALPRGWCHFPEYGEAWFQGLTAEELRKTVVRGFHRYHWAKVRPRNEPLDCRILARAALAAMGADRWTEDQWRRYATGEGKVRRRPERPAPVPAAQLPSDSAAAPSEQTIERRRRRPGGWLTGGGGGGGGGWLGR